jgi:hypothetical protein
MKTFFRFLAGLLTGLGCVVLFTSYVWLVMTSPKFVSLLENGAISWYTYAGIGLLSLSVVVIRALLYHPDAQLPDTGPRHLFCVWCGGFTPYDPADPDERATKLMREHSATCPEHPAVQQLAERNAL